MEREWAKGLRYRNSQARNQALPHWLSYYNERRPHSALNGRPPISRAHNLSGQDSWPRRKQRATQAEKARVLSG
jgi:transposase InsO family protein